VARSRSLFNFPFSIFNSSQRGTNAYDARAVNYLAHLFLAGRSAESLIGNLAGDFVKGPLREGQFPDAIRDGILRHRRLDAFTDSHPRMSAFRRVLLPEYGHWSRVIADVFLDHFLASDFERYGSEPLETFVTRIHATIDTYPGTLPGHLPLVYPLIRDQGWLVSYRSPEAIARTLRGMSRRIARHPELAGAARHLIDSREELEAQFHPFFSEAVAYANALPFGG
jgi:acyl carrier protein phosphodiesterase